MCVSEIHVNQIRVNQGLGVISNAFIYKMEGYEVIRISHQSETSLGI